MKVHIHSDCYWFGGSEHAIALLLENLGEGHQQVDLTFSYRRHAPYEAGLERIVGRSHDHHGVRLPEPGDTRNRLLRWTLRNKYVVCIWDVIVLLRLFRRVRPDVVHVNNGGWPAAVSCHAAAIAARLAGARSVLYVVNNLAQPYTTTGRRLERPLDRLVVRCVSRFATASRFAGARLQEVLGLDTRRLTTLPNSVLLPKAMPSQRDARRRLGLDPERNVIAAIGRLEPRKGHRHLVEAAACLRSRAEKPWQFVIAGDGPELERLEQQVVDHELHDVVTLLGPVDEPWDVLRAADVVALPSVGHEDLPIVVLEAMAAGRPVVASRVAGTPEEIADGETGLLVAPGDVGALSSALELLMGDPAGRAAFGAAGRMRFERLFSPDELVARYSHTYRELYQGAER